VKRWILPIIFILVVIAVYIAADTYFFSKEQPFDPGTDAGMIEHPATEPQQDVLVQAPVQEDQAARPPVTITEIPIPRDAADMSFDEVKAELAALCRELETRDYIRARNLEGSLHQRLDTLIEKLAYHPPIVSGETNDLYSLLSNAAHFYRVLGKENVGLFRDILSHEHKRIEPAMALVFQYLVKGSAENKLNVNTGQLYEYAGFFLNTLGGQSYLYRRDSLSRTLTKYYSVLILDMADKETMNPYGIDIRPHLRLIQEDMKNIGGLRDKARYQARLKEIEASFVR
jgi:hypothetical protein